MLTNVLLLSMIVISASLAAVILVQNKGTGVGSVFGGGGGVYRSRRGAEKFLHYLTIILAALFTLVSLTLLIIR
ncbi:MAG: preprotein translocase subunit SecG [Candidatus Woykebacteria bacterium]